MCGYHSCLASWEARVQALLRPSLKVLKYLRKKGCLYIDICKWQDLRVFSDKDVKLLVTRVPYQLGNTLLGKSVDSRARNTINQIKQTSDRKQSEKVGFLSTLNRSL